MALNIFNFSKKQEELWNAAKSGDVDGIKKALSQKSVDINAQNKDNLTALILAAQNAHIEAVDFLLANGANKDISNNEGFAILQSCAKRGETEIVRQLCKILDVKQNKSACDVLTKAVSGGHIKIVDILLDWGVSPNCKNNDQESAISLAISSGHTDILKLLAKRGADLKQLDEDGAGLLWYITVGQNHQAQVEMAQFLLDSGLDVNYPHKHNNRTPLIDAAIAKNLDLVRLYLENGADIDMQDINGYTALMFAVYHHHPKLVALLLANDAEVNIKRNNGETALSLGEKMYYNTGNPEHKAEYINVLQTLMTNGAIHEIYSIQSATGNGTDVCVFQTTSIKQTVAEKDGKELIELADNNANFLKRLVRTGLILEAFQKMSYEQTSELYKKAETKMSPDVKKKAQEIVRDKRVNSVGKGGME